jgi:hypothetical protein
MVDALAQLFTGLGASLGGDIGFSIILAVCLIALAIMAFGVGYGLSIGASMILVVVGFAFEIVLMQYIGFIVIALIVFKFVMGLTGG